MIRFSANIKPNYTDIIRAYDNNFDACSFVIKKENITNAGFINRNIELARKEFADNNKEMLFVALGILDDDVTKQDLENMTKIAEKIGCVFYISYDCRNIVTKKSVILKNTKTMDTESIVKNILSRDFDLALDISALYLGSKKFLEDLELLLGTYMDRIKIIFFSDAVNDETNIPIGDGSINTKQTMALIQKFNYKRAIILDVDKNSQKDSLTILKNYMEPNKPKKLPLKAVFFDADKTLYSINTDYAYDLMYDYIAKNENVTKNKIKKLHKQEIDKIKKSKKPKLRKYEYSIERIVSDKDTTKKALNIFWNEVMKNLVMFDGAKDTLHKIKNEYKLNIIITSDEFIKILKRKLNSVYGDYNAYISALVTPEVVNEMKPSAKYYKYALELFNLKPEEVIIIGDSLTRDLVEAKKLGIATIHFMPKKLDSVIDNFNKIGVIEVVKSTSTNKDIKCADYTAKSYAEIEKIIKKLVKV
ncbi:HAD hydrolase-like protein [archaeon]|nr:HAD hydrolase-like protein [archaeon]